MYVYAWASGWMGGSRIGPEAIFGQDALVKLLQLLFPIKVALSLDIEGFVRRRKNGEGPRGKFRKFHFSVYLINDEENPSWLKRKRERKRQSDNRSLRWPTSDSQDVPVSNPID